VSRPDNGFAIGRAIVLGDVTGWAVDALLIATGVATTRVLEAADLLAKDGVRCAVLHHHTVKPLDVAATLEQARRTPLVVTVEEHTVIGGLGSAVTDALVEHAGGMLPAIKRLGIPDVFAAKYGNQDNLMEIYGLMPAQIAATVRAASRAVAAA